MKLKIKAANHTDPETPILVPRNIPCKPPLKNNSSENPVTTPIIRTPKKTGIIPCASNSISDVDSLVSSQLLRSCSKLDMDSGKCRLEFHTMSHSMAGRDNKYTITTPQSALIVGLLFNLSQFIHLFEQNRANKTAGIQKASIHCKKTESNAWSLSSPMERLLIPALITDVIRRSTKKEPNKTDSLIPGEVLTECK